MHSKAASNREADFKEIVIMSVGVFDKSQVAKIRNIREQNAAE